VTTQDYRILPVDATAAAALQKRGFGYELVDTSDDDRFDTWLRADARGFHDGTLDAERLKENRESLRYRRTTAVVDPSGPDAEVPVGTVSSWVTPLTTSPGQVVDAWAISSVTVRPTHSGRGIARAMLEGELRTAVAAGCPVAALTVSEATLYARYGFAPAAMTADWRFTTSRIRWNGPVPGGRVDLISVQAWRDDIDELHERIRPTQPGHVEAWGQRWDRIAGITGEHHSDAHRFQAARYVDDEGVVRGLMLYRLAANGEFDDHHLTVENLASETDDAYAALWRLALTMPLVSTVIAPMRRVDEPVRWQIGDWRAAKLSPRDNLWLRIVDAPAALESRRYEVPGRVRLRISDSLGHAEGVHLLTVAADGSATVVSGSDALTGEASEVELGVSDLSAILLGGVPVQTLVAARRIRATAPDAAVATAVFRASVEPSLPFWF